jgi:hypothetical protein
MLAPGLPTRYERSANLMDLLDAMAGSGRIVRLIIPCKSSPTRRGIGGVEAYGITTRKNAS